jgi:hypothetical protein
MLTERGFGNHGWDRLSIDEQQEKLNGNETRNGLSPATLVSVLRIEQTDEL